MSTKALEVLYQEQWDTNIPMALSEAKGGKLKVYCELGEGLGTEKYTFFRDRDYSVDDKAPQFYNNDASYTGTSGDLSSYTVSPKLVYAHEHVEYAKMNKTMLKAESNFMKGFGNALALKEDIEIIKSIEVESAKGDTEIIKTGDVLKAITDDANILTFKQNCFLAVANSDSANALEGHQGVAITMDTRDYANLMPKGGTEGNMISSSDFSVYQNANGVLNTSLFGCDIVTYKKFRSPAKWGNRTGVVPKGKIYFIPQNTIGFVNWKGSDFTHSKYEPGNGDKFQFMVRTSVGAICIEPDSIIEMSVLAS